MSDHSTDNAAGQPELDAHAARWIAVVGHGRQAILIGLGFGVGLLLIVLVWIFARPLAILFLAIVIADALSPMVDWLARRVPRTVAIVAVYVAIILVFAGLAWILVPELVSQAQQVVNQAPGLIHRAQDWLAQYSISLSSRLVSLSSSGTTLNRWIVHLPLYLVSGLFDTLVLVFLSVYWLVAKPSLRRYAISLAPDEHRERASALLAELGATTGGYVRGIVLDALVTGTVAYLGLLLVGVHYALMLGLLTMLGELVPVIGPIVVSVPVILVALLQSPTEALLAFGVWIVLINLEAHIITPNIMRSQTEIPQILIVFGLFAGGTVGGVLGAIAGIPLTSALFVLFRRLGGPALRRWFQTLSAKRREPGQRPELEQRRALQHD